MRHASLFSGIGGFDLAAENVGWENVFSCEINPFGRRVLQYYWPNTTHYEDIKELQATKYNGRIDVLSGGFPCQPYSTAGKRLGKHDERHLWPEMLRIVQECKPRWIVGENVRGIASWNDGLVFEEVHTDLEAEGYEVQAFILPAAGVDAPHKRDRVFFVGHATNTKQLRLEHSAEFGDVPQGSGETWEHTAGHAQTTSEVRVVANANSDGLQGGVPTDIHQQQSRQGSPPEKRVPIRGQRVPFERFPTQPPICGGDDGLPSELDGTTFSKWRKDSVMAYGNAIVVPLVENIFKSIQAYESRKTK